MPSSSSYVVFEGSRVEVASSQSCELGEGALWHAGLGKYLTVDIYGPSVQCAGPAVYLHDTYGASSLPQCIPMPSYCGTVVPSSARGGSAELLVALADGFYSVDIATKTLTSITNPDPLAPSSNRFNDGKCSPEGRFWAGTMGNPGQVDPGVGGLFVLSSQPKPAIAKCMLSGVTISNGLAWTADGATMYYIDTVLERVDAFDYDAVEGEISNRRVAFHIPPNTGHPDGCCIDAEGNLWVAQWGGSRVVAYRPTDGAVIAQVRLPTSLISSVTFGGEGLNDLFITSAKEHLTVEERAQQPEAGNCFIVRDCGFKGVPACIYNARV